MTDLYKAFEALRKQFNEPREPQPQTILISSAEYRQMLEMPGGVCLANWAKLRGVVLDA